MAVTVSQTTLKDGMFEKENLFQSMIVNFGVSNFNYHDVCFYTFLSVQMLNSIVFKL